MNLSNTTEALAEKKSLHRGQQWPRITLVMPSYNQAGFLERTILSVLEQDYTNLEYLVVDGGSTDGSLKILHRYERHFSWWISEPDNGQSHAINKGLARATGDIIGWLNSDDTFAPQALYRIARVYRARPDVDFLYGNTWLIDAQDKVLQRRSAIQAGSGSLIRLNRNIWSQPGTTWRRSLQDKVGLLDEELHYAMDCDFWIRAALHGKILFTPFHLANLRIHEETKSTKQRDRFLNDMAEIDRRYGGECRNPIGRSMFRVLKFLRVFSSPFNIFHLMGIDSERIFGIWLRLHSRRPILGGFTKSTNGA